LKKFIISLFCITLFMGAADAAYTRGYTKRNGTRVAGYHHTAADKSRTNNYSTKGNVNPHTGKKGTKSPYKK